MKLLPAELIKKKRNGESLSKIEITDFFEDFLAGRIPDYQMSALLMSIYFQKLNAEEAAILTQVFIDSGEKLSFPNLGEKVCDKHSTGGVGDKASMILAPIAAACGVHVPMIAGRGLGHTGGTIDKLEAIPGYKTDLDLNQFQQMVNTHRLSIIGQTEDICRADKLIYAMRDVTATVESLGLIGASIMSKKIAEGIRNLVLDVKVGTGAFMKTVEEAEALAKFLRDIGKLHQVKVHSYITNMNQPLGRFIGNSLEILECIEILNPEISDHPMCTDTRELSVHLAAAMIEMSGLKGDFDQSLREAEGALVDGRAWAQFQKLVENQGGRLSELPHPDSKREVKSEASGYISSFNTEQIGFAAIELGAGRTNKEDQLDLTAGIESHFKVGDQVTQGATLFTMFSEDESAMEKASKRLNNAVKMSLQPVEKSSLILGCVDS